MSYTKLNYPIYFWSNYDKTEVDFFFEAMQGYIAIECKSAMEWEKKFNRGLLRIREEFGVDRVKLYGVYLGKRPLSFTDVEVLPVVDFLQKLWSGDLFR